MNKPTCTSMDHQKKQGSTYETTCSFTIITVSIRLWIIARQLLCTLPLSYTATTRLRRLLGYESELFQEWYTEAKTGWLYCRFFA